ncbi:hypothetical protein QTP88_012771 [Uroleucon formosanum]
MEAFRDAVLRVMSRSSEDQQMDCVLMASVQKQLTEVADAVSSVWPLAALSDPERRECAKTSAVRRFPAKSIVYGLTGCRFPTIKLAMFRHPESVVLSIHIYILCSPTASRIFDKISS